MFGDQVDDVREWADEVNESFGMSDEALTGLAASFGDLMVPMGFTREQAAKMSQEVIGLSGALSAWSGGQRSAAEVSEILAKAMLGEREGLKSLGISLSEADVKARLAAKGQDKLTGAALEQAKAVATQELIFEKSADAQKAWSDGSMDAVKDQNELKATIEDLKVSLAEKLLPIALKVTEWLKETLPKAIDAAKRAFDRISPIVKDVFGGGRRLFEDLADTFDVKEETILKVLAGITAGLVGLAVAWNLGPGVVITGLFALGAAFLYAYENSETFREGVQTALETTRAVITSFVNGAKALWKQFGDTIVGEVRRVWPNVQQMIGGALDAIRGVIKIVTSLIKGDWSGVWEGIRQYTSGVWNGLLGLAKFTFEQIRLAVDITMRAAAAVFGVVWDGITGAFRSAVNFVIDAWNRLDFEIDIKVPSWVPGVGGKGFYVSDIFPDVPRLAQGAVVSQPTLAWIGEDSRTTPEIVAPERTLRTIVRQESGGGMVVNQYVTVQGSIIRERELGDYLARIAQGRRRRGGTALDSL